MSINGNIIISISSENSLQCRMVIESSLLHEAHMLQVMGRVNFFYSQLVPCLWLAEYFLRLIALLCPVLLWWKIWKWVYLSYYYNEWCVILPIFTPLPYQRYIRISIIVLIRVHFTCSLMRADWLKTNWQLTELFSAWLPITIWKERLITYLKYFL